MKVQPIKSIRLMLGATQVEVAEALDCTQESVSRYERGATVPPDRVPMVIAFAQGRGVRLTFGMVYGVEPLPMVRRETVLGVTL